MGNEATKALRIIVEDASFVILEKPAGIPAQPDNTGDMDLLSMIREQLKDPGIGLVHRLDRPVSGVMVFARNEAALADLNRQFQERTVRKVYWAIVEGAFPVAKVLENLIEHDAFHKKARVGAGIAHDARTVRISVKPLAVGDRYSLVEVIPEGGAFHQIRVQLSAAGHPIKGDVKYGARRGEKDRSIALHSRAIDLDHPVSGIRLSYTANTPSAPLWKMLEAMIVIGSGR